MPQPDFTTLHVDRALTAFSLAFMNRPDTFVADRAFPLVRSEYQSDVYYTYDKRYWFSNEFKLRAPGAPYPTSGYAVTTASFQTYNYALAKEIPWEYRNNADAQVQLDQEAAEWLAHKALIHRELAFAASYMVNSVWTTNDNNSATDWDSSGTPITNAGTVAATMQGLTGLTPNTLVCGLVVFNALQTNAEITGKVAYTQRALPRDLGTDLIAAALNLEQVLVSRAAYNSADEGESASMAPIIDDDALFLYSNSSPSLRSASGGITVYWEGAGGFGAVERVSDELNDRDVAKMKMSYNQLLVSADLGYLFLDIV